MSIRLFITISLSFTLIFNSFAEGNDISSSKYYYRVYFADKGDLSTFDYVPENLLSPAALARREKCGTETFCYTDLPVNTGYVNSIKQLGLTFRYASKWMNTALFCTEGPFDIAIINSLPYVKKVLTVKRPAEPTKGIIEKYGVIKKASAADVFRPVVSINGTPLHLSGYTGKGVTVAVLDAGFRNADNIESLSPLMLRGGVIKTWDFVKDSSYVYDYEDHGTMVMSILAGYLPGIIEGTAPDANYMLFRTEDAESEFPVEEDYWVAAAEYADSAGVDIITASLGYFLFDDPLMNYSFSDADGNTAFVTIAADIAASKGILVVSSAGNERDKEWIRIIFPSDGDNVLCIGAVNQNLTISSFSSAGYSADGRVKPDVVAPGVSLPLQYVPGLWHTGSGTSFSCPVISGMCASLMQAVPGATANDIRDAVRESSDRYNNPDSLYGYGLPDFTKAFKILEETYVFKPDVVATAGPNPFFDIINLWFHETPERLSVTITDISGRTVRRVDHDPFIGRSYNISDLANLGQGLYIIKVTTALGEASFKMIKLQR